MHDSIHSKMPTISKIVIFCFPSPILKDEYVSHNSLYDGSCNRRVHTNRSDAPISKKLSNKMSIHNNVHWISKTCILILNKILLMKSLGTHMPRSPHYHVLGPPLNCLSPQAFLATKYLASLAYSIG
jgi:hypothetical protein